MSDLKPFQREWRFIVVKRKHITAEQEIQLVGLINSFGCPDVECVVVESDWPEYETVWKMIEDRVTGNTRPAPTGEHMTGPRNGVNCSNCGCRLPADYRGACPDCDALSIDFAQTGEPVAEGQKILTLNLQVTELTTTIAALKAAGGGLADELHHLMRGTSTAEGLARLAAWEALTND